MAILVSWMRVAQTSLAGELPMDPRLLPRELSSGAGLWISPPQATSPDSCSRARVLALRPTDQAGPAGPGESGGFGESQRLVSLV